jgi:hydrogenase maturation protein HypF
MRGGDVSPQARLRLLCRGVVQGVGFRPLVRRLAAELALVGEIENVACAVRLCLQGERRSLEQLIERLPAALPPQGRLDPLEPEWLPPVDPAPRGLQIMAASARPLGPGLIAPSLAADLAPCDACLAELRDPVSRRYRYPFISCTRCGPRYSIASAEPFTRAHTTLATFPLCPSCQREFTDPSDRRFHAETISCPACGPRLRLLASNGEPLVTASRPADPITATADLLNAGAIVALQGVGGFQLLVKATNTKAVTRLRLRKHRPDKPFALLVGDVLWLADRVRISAEERRQLESPAAPIVLLQRRDSDRDADPVAPGSPCLGVMLPASPLHTLLVESVGAPLVATSGNRSGEPLCHASAEALEQLGEIADAFLVHNRAIARPLDDSLLQLIDGRPALLRRARGFAPEALRLPAPPPADQTVLALGGDLKAAPALAAGGHVWMSPHLGDLGSPTLQKRLHSGLECLLERHQPDPMLLVSDAHPGYGSHQLAQRLCRRRAVPLQCVQHHLAHGLAVVAEHGLTGPVLVWACDGLGYGTVASGGGSDHRLWGGELLWLEAAEAAELNARRLACLRPWPLPGGARAMAEPRRAALGLLAEAGWLDHPGAAACRAAFEPQAWNQLLKALESGCNSPRTSSLGRLFDAAASLLDLVQRLSYEGQAGLLLEGQARCAARLFPAPRPGPPVTPALPAAPPSPLPLGWLDWAPLIGALLTGRQAGCSTASLAARWHQQLSQALVALVLRAARQQSCRQVALAGGCFQNALLLETCIAELRAANLAVYWSEQVPRNDGGLALGQLWAAC